MNITPYISNKFSHCQENVSAFGVSSLRLTKPCCFFTFFNCVQRGSKEIDDDYVIGALRGQRLDHLGDRHLHAGNCLPAQRLGHRFGLLRRIHSELV